MEAVKFQINAFNAQFNASAIGKFFKLEERGSNFTTEFRGACATFLTMAYILAVNPRLLADSGGSCDAGALGGPFSTAYAACKEEVKRQMILSTALTSMVACFLMGGLANLPIALSCGMGMNAYFTFDVVGYHGTDGRLTYGAALSAVLIEGIIFTVLAVTGVRYYIIKFIPEPVRLATPAAIGAFLAHLGLQTAEGIGVVVGDVATAVTLGGCAPEYRTSMVQFTAACSANPDACIPSDNYTCDIKGGKMQSPTTWIGILGTVIMAIGLAYKVKSAFIISIGFVTFISWFRFTEITYFPDNEAGDKRFEYFQKVVAVESLDKVVNQFNFSELQGSAAALAVITMLYVDFLDTSGTLLGLVSSMDFLKEGEEDFPGSREAFTVDAVSTVFGSIFGLSPITSYIESAAGIEVGSRTGLTSIFVGFFFFLSIFFSPIIASIPPWATGGALIIVGGLMARSLSKVHWDNPIHACVAFITVMMMPLTYSIAYGLIAGIGSWFAVQLVFFPLEYFFKIPNPSTIVDETSNEVTAEKVLEDTDKKIEDVEEEPAEEEVVKEEAAEP